MRETICPGFYQDSNEAMVQLDTENNDIVSGTFLKYLDDTVNLTYSGSTDPMDLVYSTLVPLDAYHMYTLTQAMSASTIVKGRVTPASTMLLNIYSNNTVKAYYNDVEFTPLGCSEEADYCTTADFKTAI